MMHQRQSARPDRSLAASRGGVTSLLFAIMMVPLILILGIAIDFGFYIDTAAKLNLAADAAAMHAVRAASMAASNNAPGYTNAPPYEVAGAQAGYDWFAAQAGGVPEVSLNPSTAVTGTTETVPVTVTVTYSAPTYKATVSYSGTINTVFGRIVGIKTWPVAGSATSTISNSFVDFGIMIDNSQSMLIGATPADIARMNSNTPCAVVKTENGVTPGLDMRAYSYYLNGLANPNGAGAYGYNSTSNTKLPPYVGPNLPAPNPGQEFCDPNLVGGCGPAPAFGYPPSVIYGANGQLYTTPAQAAAKKTVMGACNNGGGRLGVAGQFTPQAPCAFACHQNPDGGDWYAVARNLGVKLRLDVVQQAAQQLLQTMETYSKPPQTLLNVGIYTFNSTFQPVYPCATCGSPFGDDLNTAAGDLAVCTAGETSGCLLPPVTQDNPNTDYPNVFAQAAAYLAGTPGNGLSQATAFKNLFIITDGVSDWNVDANNLPVGVNADGSPNGGVQQVVGPLDQLIVKPCDALKQAGFTIYVLYTPYQPLPTWTYSFTKQPAEPAGVNSYPQGVTLQNFVTEADPVAFPDYNAQYTDTPVQAALRACASSPNGFYTADDPTDINNALQQMLATALNSAAQVTN